MSLTPMLTKGVLTALWGFWRRDVKPRWSDIVFTQDFGTSLSVGILLAFVGPSALTGAPKVVDVANGFIAYAAIAMGFCVGGMTIALTLPDRIFVQKLATLEIPGKAGNALSGLLFVFTWTAVVHWLAIMALLIAMVSNGGNPNAIVANLAPVGRVLLGCVGFICCYALFQFLITVLTLAHVGLHYIDRMRIAPDEQPTDKNGSGRAM